MHAHNRPPRSSRRPVGLERHPTPSVTHTTPQDLTYAPASQGARLVGREHSGSTTAPSRRGGSSGSSRGPDARRAERGPDLVPAAPMLPKPRASRGQRQKERERESHMLGASPRLSPHLLNRLSAQVLSTSPHIWVILVDVIKLGRCVFGRRRPKFGRSRPDLIESGANILSNSARVRPKPPHFGSASVCGIFAGAQIPPSSPSIWPCLARFWSRPPKIVPMSPQAHDEA